MKKRTKDTLLIFLIIVMLLLLAFEMTQIENILRHGSVTMEEKCRQDCAKEHKVPYLSEDMCYCKEAVVLDRQMHCFSNVTFTEDQAFSSKFNTSMVRNIAVAAAISYPSPNSYATRIFSVYRKAGDRISYVSDPRQDDYIASPEETWDVRGGDCDDSSLLLSALYESIGLDASIVEARNLTYGHVFVIVRVDQDLESFLKEYRILVEKYTTYFGAKPFNFLVFRDTPEGCIFAEDDLRAGREVGPFYVIVESTAKGYPGKQDPTSGFSDFEFIKIGA
jgi:hypothetical protein